MECSLCVYPACTDIKQLFSVIQNKHVGPMALPQERLRAKYHRENCNKERFISESFLLLYAAYTGVTPWKIRGKKRLLAAATKRGRANSE